MRPVKRMRRWVKIGPPRRKTPLERVVKAARDVDLPAGVVSALNDLHVPKRVRTGVTAVVTTTAVSTGISALRRRIGTPAAGR